MIKINVLINNRYLKNIIIFTLVLTLIISFISVPIYAEAIVLTNIGVKVVVTILASMGVLAFVNAKWGVIPFYEELIEYAETVKGIIDFGNILIDIGVKAIRNNIKMKIDNIKSVIKDFYYSKIATLPQPFEPTPDVSDAIVRFNYSKYGVRDEIFNGQEFFEPIGLTEYRLRIAISVQDNWTGRGPRIYMSIYRGNVYVDNTQQYIQLPKIDKESYVDLKLKCQLVDDGYIVDYYVFDYDKNMEYSDSIRFGITPLSSYIDLDGIDPPIPSPDIPAEVAPIPKAVPNNLTLPWEKGIDTSGIEGSTVETVVERVAEGSIEDYTEEVIELPKAIVDATEPNIIEVDEAGTILEVEFPDISPVIEENLKQTSLLESILSFLQSLFDVPSDIEIDFSPIKNLAIKEKFPFSLPWDLKGAINTFVKPPVVPHFELPILGNTIDIDFTQFESLASISRTFTTIIYIVFLIILTKRFIG